MVKESSFKNGSLSLPPESDIAAAGTARGGHGELGAAAVADDGDGGSFLQ